MTKSKMPPIAELEAALVTLGGNATAKKFGVHRQTVYDWKMTAERELGRTIDARDSRVTAPRLRGSYIPTISCPVNSGLVLVGSDAHIWPGNLSCGQRAFIRFTKELKPAVIVMNGDVIDAPRISRHPPIGWEKQPEVQEEIEAATDFLHEVESASGKRCRRIWTLGNHDARFETWLASHAPQFRNVKGIHLKDHFPNWEPGWAAEIGGPAGAVVKHRFKGGIHATHNNALWSGRSMVTGHLHSAKVVPFTDYNGTRYGVDTGCLAKPSGEQFNYTEDNPLNWRSGFGVFTFHKGELLYPELVTVFDEEKGLVQFRGELIRV